VRKVSCVARPNANLKIESSLVPGIAGLNGPWFGELVKMNRGASFNRSAGRRSSSPAPGDYAPPSRITLLLRRAFVRLSEPPLHRLGLTLFLVLFIGTGAFGAVRGGHVDAVVATAHEAGDTIARGFGFGIVHADVRGMRVLGRDEILARAGVTDSSSLLFLNPDVMREALKAEPRIAEATVRKLYPDRLEIVIEEREPFARWQRAGKVHLIARDGTVLASDIEGRAAELPLVVGIGAEKNAATFLDLMARFPSISDEVRAGVFIAERRWNLRLKNGMDVQLPEEDPALALERLVQLDRSRELLTRDLTTIDLRVPDRVSVTPTNEAAEALKQKTAKRKGADS
jgi:cell division protein FtsQ